MDAFSAELTDEYRHLYEYKLILKDHSGAIEILEQALENANENAYKITFPLANHYLSQDKAIKAQEMYEQILDDLSSKKMGEYSSELDKEFKELVEILKKKPNEDFDQIVKCFQEIINEMSTK